MVSGTNMVKIIVCIFTILFYAQKKQSLWHERHFLGMNDILFHRQHINNGMLNNPFEILSKTKINDAYHEYVQEGAKYVIVVIWNMYDLV